MNEAHEQFLIIPDIGRTTGAPYLMQRCGRTRSEACSEANFGSLIS
ncbi:hypothetical protein JOC55_003748 [Paenibacillus sacheonensis]|nr:hypothetical protein [Paenibacillus sacheonensis]